MSNSTQTTSAKASPLWVSLFLSLLYACPATSQQVSRIFTDYRGYWMSRTVAINAIKPDLSHNLLAFTYNGVTYSTGVNNAVLSADTIVYTPGDFRALPVSSIGGIVVPNSTYILIPSADDGVPAGTITPLPSVTIRDVLTDGINGLNIGSGVTNLPPTSTMIFPVNSINPPNISDQQPDILYTQIAAMEGPADVLHFEDLNGVTVGNSVTVNWNNIASLGNHTCDLYRLTTVSADDAIINAVSSAGGTKPIRVAAFRLSEFGITAANAGSVVNLVIKPGGASDPAFVAYNASAFVVLPVTFTFVKGAALDEKVQITWQTSMEANADRFVIEGSSDGQSFSVLGSVPAVGNSQVPQNYSFNDGKSFEGVHYYRIRQYDKDGKYTLSPVIKVAVSFSRINLAIQPNPSSDWLRVSHPASAGDEFIQVYNMQGLLMDRKKIRSGAVQTELSTQGYPAGTYQLLWTNGKENALTRFVVR